MSTPHFGLTVLPDDWASLGSAARRRLLAEMESAGIDHVLVNDHVSFRGGWGCDGLVAAGSVLAASDSIGAYVAAYLLPLRHPVAVARQLATLSQLAPGRLILGVGVGGEDRAEVQACGVDPSTRGRRTDEALVVVRSLLAGGKVSFEGEFFELDSGLRAPRARPSGTDHHRGPFGSVAAPNRSIRRRVARHLALGRALHEGRRCHLQRRF